MQNAEREAFLFLYTSNNTGIPVMCACCCWRLEQSTTQSTNLGYSPPDPRLIRPTSFFHRNGPEALRPQWATERSDSGWPARLCGPSCPHHASSALPAALLLPLDPAPSCPALSLRGVWYGSSAGARYGISGVTDWLLGTLQKPARWDHKKLK